MCLFPLGHVPDLLEVAETGGVGPISWRNTWGTVGWNFQGTLNVAYTHLPRVTHQLVGLEWGAPASWPPNPHLPDSRWKFLFSTQMGDSGEWCRAVRVRPCREFPAQGQFPYVPEELLLWDGIPSL